MRVYLSGKMSGEPEFNFPAFRTATEDLRRRGYEVISPVEMDEEEGFTPDPSKDLTPEEYSHFLARDVAAMAASEIEAIVVLAGWEQSGGAKAEVAFARALGLPVLRYPALNLVPEAPARILHAVPDLPPPAEEASIRTFDTGATRDLDERKPDFEAFLSPTVIREFGAYMHRHRMQADGTLRAGDNWQKGMPLDAYMKSLWRHFLDAWTLHRGLEATDYDGKPVEMREALCAMLFNVQGYLHELARAEADVPTP